MMRLAAPQYLLLLVALAWLWRTGHRSAGAPRARAAVRCAIAMLLILAASRLQVRSGESPLALMFVVDVSDSMNALGGAMMRRVDGITAGLRTADRAGLVVFAGSSAIEREASVATAPVSDITSEVPKAATDIEAALRLARMSLPSEGLRRIVLMSDGNQTRGDAMREASLAADSGIFIDAVLPSEANATRWLTVTRLSAPTEGRVGEPFVLTAFVEGPANALGEIVVHADGKAAVTQEVRTSAQGFATASFSERRTEPGVYVYRAAIRALETDASFTADSDEPSAGAVVTIAGEARVLYAGANPAVLRAALSPRFRVESRSPAELPRAAAGLSAYDAVILDDVAPDVLEAAQTAALTQHVAQQGGGLLVLGSTRSLDAGIFPDSAFGKLLPVDVRPRSGQRAPDLALVIVFDKSGSMDDRVDGAAKIDYARQAIRRALDAVPATDAVGVIAFDANPVAVAPLRTAHDPRTVLDALRLIEPGGSTAMAPAMALARDWLATPAATRFSRRHVLLITDGRTTPADAAHVRALVADRRFELSVVALGAGGDRRFLTALAELTGGRAYFPEDVRELPATLAREAARVAGGRVVQEPFTVRDSRHPMTTGMEAGTWPTLGGYVITAAKATAETALVSHLDDPVLATWRFGLGKVAVYTADLHSPWSASLRAWDQFAPLLTQTVRWVGRPGGYQSLYSRFVQSGDRMRVAVDAVADGGEYISLLEVRASMRTPAGSTRGVALAETRPGRYEGELPVAERGAHIVALSARSRDGTFDSHVLRGFYWTADQEYRAHGVNRALLARLAEATGGRVVQAGDDTLPERPPFYVDIRGWLLGAAFILFLGDILAPRVRGLRQEAAANRGDSAGRVAAA